MTPKIKIWKKCKKHLETLSCTINQDHMMYGSWDIKQSFLSFCLFCPLTLLTTQRIKILKKWKKTPRDNHHFTQVYHKWQSYDIWFPRYQLQQTYFFFCHLRPFFPHFTPLTAQKLKSSKNEKNTRRYHHFPQVYQKSWSCYTVPEVWHVIGVIVVFHLGLIFALLPP